MKLGLKVAGAIALMLLILFFIHNLFNCFNQASDGMVIVAILGFLALIVLSTALGQWTIKQYAKKGKE